MSRCAVTARRRLVALLQAAYSGELAAARAYRGHGRSVRDSQERARIQVIEAEELEHRARVGAMLAELGAAPSGTREAVFGAIGSTLGGLCYLTGWLAPMFGAGCIEERNIGEYTLAARLAAIAGLDHLCDALLEMAEVEHDHEAYFRERVKVHTLARWLPMWRRPPPREALRVDFRREHPGVLPAQAPSRDSSSPSTLQAE